MRDRPATGFAGATDLPDYVQAAARKRLGVVSALFVVLGLLTIGVALVGGLTTSVVPSMSAVVVIATGLLVVARSSVFSTKTALRGALVGLVLYCVVFSFLIAKNRYLNFGVPGDATWTCVLLVAFPLLIPANPREAILAMGVGALTVPAGIQWLAATTDFTLEGRSLISFALSPVFAAMIGYFGAKTIYALGIDITKAQRLGGYELDHQLGAGGMGEVWVARHARLARPAAIKFVRLPTGTNTNPRMTDLTYSRFEQEAAATASLRSPHTVEVYDFGSTSDGRFYYAMELLDGVDLEDLVARYGALPPARACFIVRQILESLREAHAGGLLHRDIKPANVMACHYGLQFDFVKVLDFGLALRLEDDRRTSDDVLVGTPAYMAPELGVAGGQPSPSSDLYSLGCLFYWLLAGRTVFDAKTKVQQLLAHQMRPPPLVSTVAPYPIPTALDELLDRMLQKKPELRVPHAEAVLAVLDDLEWEDPWTEQEAAAWWTMHEPAAARVDSDDTYEPAEATVSLRDPADRSTLIEKLIAESEVTRRDSGEDA